MIHLWKRRENDEMQEPSHSVERAVDKVQCAGSTQAHNPSDGRSSNAKAHKNLKAVKKSAAP
jgi:hypothetical protein